MTCFPIHVYALFPNHVIEKTTSRFGTVLRQTLSGKVEELGSLRRLLGDSWYRLTENKSRGKIEIVTYVGGKTKPVKISYNYKTLTLCVTAHLTKVMPGVGRVY
jgi:hypothetical protein